MVVAQTARELQDELDIPEVIKHLREERGHWLRNGHIDPMSAAGQAPDENYFVEKLKPKRDESISEEALQAVESR